MLTTTSLNPYEERTESCLSGFYDRHPLVSFLTMFMVVPAGMLLAVAVSTTVLALPMALIFGWV